MITIENEKYLLLTTQWGKFLIEFQLNISNCDIDILFSDITVGRETKEREATADYLRKTMQTQTLHSINNLIEKEFKVFTEKFAVYYRVKEGTLLEGIIIEDKRIERVVEDVPKSFEFSYRLNELGLKTIKIDRSTEKYTKPISLEFKNGSIKLVPILHNNNRIEIGFVNNLNFTCSDYYIDLFKKKIRHKEGNSEENPSVNFNIEDYKIMVEFFLTHFRGDITSAKVITISHNNEVLERDCTLHGSNGERILYTGEIQFNGYKFSLEEE